MVALKRTLGTLATRTFSLKRCEDMQTSREDAERSCGIARYLRPRKTIKMGNGLLATYTKRLYQETMENSPRCILSISYSTLRRWLGHNTRKGLCPNSCMQVESPSYSTYHLENALSSIYAGWFDLVVK